jgi:hypothetical protein
MQACLKNINICLHLNFIFKKRTGTLFQTFLFKISFYCLLHKIQNYCFGSVLRMQILGSVPLSLTNGTGSESCSFRQFYAYSFLMVHLHHSSKIKIYKEVTKEYNSRFFLICLLVDGRIRIRTNKMTDPDSYK